MEKYVSPSLEILDYIGSDSHYWSSSLYTDHSDYAYSVYFYFYSSYVIRSNYDRCFGFSVRPVQE